MTERGKYIVLEGQDGTGKTTQVRNFRRTLSEIGIESLQFDEPAGTPMADEIRTILKNGHLERAPNTDILLFTAARVEIWRAAQRALNMGIWVVNARNYWSTEAYQGHGDGMDITLIRSTTEQFLGKEYMTPDWSCVLTLDAKTRAQRIVMRGPLEKPDFFETKPIEWQNRVLTGYEKIAEELGIPTISAAGTDMEIDLDSTLLV